MSSAIFVVQSSFFIYKTESGNTLIFTMSFMGGAECSTAGNPLTQFSKHVQNDSSLQRDRLVGNAPGAMGETMRSRMAPTGSDQVCGMLRV